MTGTDSLLNADHHAQIQQALARIEQTQHHIDMAKRAKINVAAEEQALATAKEKLLLLKNVYFPNGM